MKCPKCGAEVREDARFCENCGAPIMIKGKAENGAKEKKIIIALIAAIVVVAGVIGIICFTGEDSSAYSEKLKLAEQYVTEGDLEAAEIQYKELIDLEPKKETAYIELAKEVYVEQERYEDAIEILEKGLAATGGSGKIEKTIVMIRESQEENKEQNDYNDGQEFTDSQYSEEISASVNSSECDIPKEQFLYDFLIRYYHFRGEASFDANHPGSSGGDNIMYSLGSDTMMNSSLYNAENYVTWAEQTDPRGWQKELGINEEFGIMIADKSKADWLAANLFNVSEDGIRGAVKELENQKTMYAEDGKYYGLLVRTGMGIPSSVEITECRRDGNTYDMVVDFNDMVGTGTKTMYAKTELKKIDGIWYWTLHSITTEKPSEQ